MKYTINKVTMENSAVHYRLKFTKWHLLKCFFRSSNTIFAQKYESYEKALLAIDIEEARLQSNKKIGKESFTVCRTDIPSHIPKEQRMRYFSTPKLTDL